MARNEQVEHSSSARVMWAMWAMRKRGGASIRWRCPVSLLLYDLSSFCLFFSDLLFFFFFLFLTRTWTWTYWHTESLIHWTLFHFWGTNDSDARARARAVGVLTLHRADFQRVLAQRAIPPARPHFGKRLVDYVCVPLLLLLMFCSFNTSRLTYLLTFCLTALLIRSFVSGPAYVLYTHENPSPFHSRPRVRRPRCRHADITAKTRRRAS